MNVLVTGGAGGVARYVASEFADRHNLTLFVRIGPGEVSYSLETDLPFVRGDLTSFSDCMCAVAFPKADATIHLGAIPHNTERQPGQEGVARLPEDETMRVNVMGT